MRWALLLLLFAGAALASAAQTPAPGVRSLSAGAAEALLHRPAAVDPQALRLLQRVTAAYGKLNSLESRSVSGETVAVARVKRPRFYHFQQQTRDGKLLALAVSDGKHYYEYTEQKKQYLERDAAVLDHLTLPMNVRLFFTTQKPDAVMSGLDGRPAVREFAYRYQGKQTVSGKPAELLVVSTVIRRGVNEWQTFESARCFDATSGLLLRALNGKRTIDVENKPSPRLPDDVFLWRPVPGAMKGFG